MKKVLIVVAGNNGTIGRCSLNLYRAFKDRVDVNVKCVVIHRFQDGFEGFNDCEFFSDAHKNQENSIRSQVKWLNGIKRDFCPDLTISTLHSTDVLNCLAKGNDKRVGIFHAPHKQGKAFGLVKYLLMMLPYYFLFRRLDLCSCVSKEVEEDLRSLNFTKEDRIKTIYNIHNVNEITAKAKEPVTDLPEELSYFIYCGRLDANKAPIRAIKALAQLKTDTSLVFVGKGEESFVQEVKKQVDEMRLNDRIFFLGAKDNPYPYIKGAKALVSCSYSEGLPGVIIEAMALGVPVVSTNSSLGIWEILMADASYDKQLSSVVETKYGIITSNLSIGNKDEEENDTHYLAVGLEKTLGIAHFTNAEFLPKVDGNSITQQYLSLLS
jgi:glycosyltransferase involved in cell wall biosynthesis